jgi:hypothetical protein
MKTNLTMDFLLLEINALIGLQAELLAVFESQYPTVHDWELLLDCPKSGRVRLGSEGWSFRKHGAGLSFEGDRGGAIVDLHKNLKDTGSFDEWRVLQYLESRGFGVDAACVKRGLNRLENAGSIWRVGVGCYELAPDDNEAAE